MSQLLLNAVIDDPDADAPRLAYASACEAAGERDRARFIRLQLEEATLRRQGRDDAYKPAIAARELAAPHRNAWAGPIHTMVREYEFYRGFVEKITLLAEDFLRHADELYRLAPIRRLSLKGVKPFIRGLSEASQLDRIVSLTLDTQDLEDRDLEVLASSPHLTKLVSLRMPFNHVTEVGVETLAASKALPALRKISLSGNPGEWLSEGVFSDQGSQHLDPVRNALRDALEARRGRKAWLHTFEDLGRELHESEL